MLYSLLTNINTKCMLGTNTQATDFYFTKKVMEINTRVIHKVSFPN